MPAYIPFRDVPEGAVFRFDKDGEGVRWKKARTGVYYSEGGGFEYLCSDPERPSLLLGSLQLVDWKPGEFGIINNEEDPYYLGYSKGQRWNGWACPVFPWESVLQIARDIDRQAAEYPQEAMHIVVDEENRRVWIDERAFYEDGYYEVEPEELWDGTPVWGIGSGSWTWNDKRDFAEED